MTSMSLRNVKNDPICGPFCSSETVRVPFYNVKHCIKWPLCGSFYTWISGETALRIGTIRSFQTPKTAQIAFSLQDTRNFVPRKRIRSGEISLKGLGKDIWTDIKQWVERSSTNVLISVRRVVLFRKGSKR